MVVQKQQKNKCYKL